MSTCGKSVDHCVQATGVDTSSYWKVRNSWGTSWGDGGFMRTKMTDAKGVRCNAVAKEASYFDFDD